MNQIINAKRKMIKIIQSLEFIRSSLNSLDVAAEFECARGLSDDDIGGDDDDEDDDDDDDDDDLSPEFKGARSRSFVTDNLLL